MRSTRVLRSSSIARVASKSAPATAAGAWLPTTTVQGIRRVRHESMIVALDVGPASAQVAPGRADLAVRAMASDRQATLATAVGHATRNAASAAPGPADRRVADRSSATTTGRVEKARGRAAATIGAGAVTDRAAVSRTRIGRPTVGPLARPAICSTAATPSWRPCGLAARSAA